MADFPTFRFGALRESAETADDGVKIDRAVNGSARARSLWVSPKLMLSVRLILDAEERVTLDAFYLANRALVVAYNSELATGNFLFASPPQYKRVSPEMFEVTVKLEEV